jgi:hypothetical protein
VPYDYRLLPRDRVAAEAVNRDLKAAAKMLSALVACCIPFNYSIIGFGEKGTSYG